MHGMDGMRGIRGALERDGFIKLAGSYTDSDFVGLARGLGEVIDDTPVRVVPGKRTYLASPGAIPLHTDHPSADMIAWLCEAQDPNDGASWLVDGRRLVAGLGADVKRALARTLLPAMVRLGDEPLPTPILSDETAAAAIFYAPWLEPIDRPTEALEPLRAFRRALEGVQPTAHRLTRGEVLVIDNRRFLHGRGRLDEASSRRLRRLWIRRSAHSVEPCALAAP